MKLIKISHQLVIGIILGLLSSLIGLVIPLIIKQFVDFRRFNHLKISLIVIGVILIISNMLITTISDYLISSEGDRQLKKIRLKLQEKSLKLPQSYFDRQISTQLTSRVINDSGILRSFLTETIPTTVNSIFTIIGIIMVMLTLDWKLTLLILVTFPCDALITVPLGKINEKIASQTQKALSNLMGVTNESLKNSKTIKLNNAQQTILSKVTDSLNQLLKLSLRSDRIAAVTSPLQSMMSLILVLGVVLYGTSRVSTGSLSVGTLSAFMVYFFQIISPINSIALFYTDYHQMLGATEKIREIMDYPSEDLSRKAKQLVKDSDKDSGGTLQLKNVTFAYNKENVLEKINLEVKTGEKIALVGATGAGKSTVVNLITGLYPVNDGYILFNGQNAKNFDLKQWRSMFSVVSQENTVLTGSFRQNLILGLNRNVDDAELFEALKAVNLDHLVKSYKNGLDTKLGEEGTILSGGQKQRLQMARAYLRNCKFIVLDEATSSLDSDTEKQVSDSLDNLMTKKNCGMITIAHRLSTIMNSDRIYFLRNKHFIASGTHEELMNILPDYRQYVCEQDLRR